MATINSEIRNEILRNMECELDDRYYDYNRYALNRILDAWNTAKNPLIELLSKHPLWNPERLMIQFDADFEREICTEEVRYFVSWLRDKVNGYWTYGWDNDQTNEYYICNFIEGIHTQFFDESMRVEIEHINSLNENFKLRTNMKSSKAIRKICVEMGWDKLEDFNKRYSALADCLNPIRVKRHTCISVNPLDYLLMSNGTSWNSCHDIGESGDYGCYSSGTVSYMLDEHSFIFYTVDASYDGDCIEREPKVQRAVFAYNDEVLLQSRLYPQSNDCGAEQIYTDIREIVQKVIADCLGKPNLWIKSHNDIQSVVRKGYGATCYPDFKSGNPGAEHCTLSTLKEREKGKEDRHIVLGAQPICIECGSYHCENENINCCNGNVEYCEHCGCRINRNDAYWVGDYPYCEDCVTYCEQCGEYVLNEDATEVDGYYYCDECINNGDANVYRCDECGELHHMNDMTDTEDDYWYCEDCAERHTFDCDECNKTYSNNEKNYDEETGLYYCDDCYEKLLEEREKERETNEELVEV